MKKISSFILALIIALSLTTAAFAASPTINVGDTKSLTLKQDESVTYKFTAQKTGIYAIDLTAKNDCYVYCEVYNVKNTDEAVNGMSAYIDMDGSTDHTFSFPANNGSSFTIILTELSENDPDDPDLYEFEVPAKIDFALREDNVPFVRLGGTYSVDEDFAQFAFVPSESGKYNFRSAADSDFCDPLAVIYDDMNNYKYNDDIGYEDDWNFDLSFRCEAGKIYLIAIGTSIFDEDYSDPDFTFTVKKADNIKPEYIVPLTESFSMAKNDWNYIYAAIVPAGADVNFDIDDVTVTSSKPRVADVEYYELYDNVLEIEVDSFRLGKTTITIELSNGESTDIVVKVKPNIILWIEWIFSVLFG